MIARDDLGPSAEVDLEHLVSRLSTGFFAARAADCTTAQEIVQGEYTVAGRVLDLEDPASFDLGDELPRNHLLSLHTLRWLDPLRRAAHEVEGASAAWERIVMAWSRSAAAADPGSVAWLALQVELRSTALALGTRTGGETSFLLDLHLERLAAIEAEARTADRRLALLRVRLALQYRRGDGIDALQAAAVAAAEAAFAEDGYAVAGDLAVLAGTAALWEEELLGIGLPHDAEVLSRLRSTGFWVHAMTPAGVLAPVGGAVPDPIPGAQDPMVRYVVTGGAEGSAPAAISHVDPTGLVTLRSGWGETERDAREETLATMILGPVRGRDAHQDPARLTYHSQGRDWLIDPMDEAASGVDAHSVVTVEGVRYRLHGGAELVRHYADEQVEGLWVRTSLHLRVQWSRHVVFARTGNYLVLDDTVRSSQEYRAHLRWIIAPDVEITPTRQGFLLGADGKFVSITVSTSGLKDHVIDDLCSASGDILARRISVPMVGTSNRAVSVIADVVDPELFSVRRPARSGKEFTIDIRDKHLDETLVVTPEISAVVPSGLDPDEAVERTIARAAAGDLGPEEALEQRVSVRRAIHDAKETVRSGGGDAASRRRAIAQLVAAGEELRVTGLRDHAFGAALVDLAGMDLAAEVSAHPQVAGLRRTPLVRFGEEELLQPGYSVPVLTSLDAGTLPDQVSEPSVWSVDLGQLVPSTYLHDAPGDILTVYFHGATDRTKFTMPRYERLRSMPQLDLGPVMFFSDPSLDLDSRMILSWYVGTEDVDLHREIARMIDAYARHRGISKILLVGNSGGGFTALQLGALLAGTRVVAFNPQVQVDRYVPRIAQTAHWALFGRGTVADDPEHAPRMDLLEKYRRIDFDQEVLLIQNPGDDHHHQEHFLPFVEAFSTSAHPELLHTLTPYLGPGHRVPPVDEYLRIVREAALSKPDRPWVLEGLREDSCETGEER